MDTILRIKNIDVSYGETGIIKNLLVDLHSGSLIGLIGPNGAGKTTFLLSISGQFKPKSGAILYNNIDIYEKNFEYKTSIGYVDENPFFYSYLTAEEFLYFVGKIKKIPRNELHSDVTRTLETVCLLNEKHKKTSLLSAGMRKKLAIAAALLGSPKILFLDESLNGIDIESTFQIKKALKDIVSAGTIIILSTHVLEVIEKICDRYLVMKNGNIIADFQIDEAGDSWGNVSLETHVINLLRDQ